MCTKHVQNLHLADALLPLPRLLLSGDPIADCFAIVAYASGALLVVSAVRAGGCFGKAGWSGEDRVACRERGKRGAMLVPVAFAVWSRFCALWAAGKTLPRVCV